jgi:tetratricopeptide (TPR) repeat protein
MISKKVKCRLVVMIVGCIPTFFLFYGLSLGTTLKDLNQDWKFDMKEYMDYLKGVPHDRKTVSEALDLVNSGKYKEAIDLLNKFLKTNPSSSPAHEILGAALALDGKVDEGLKELEKAVQINPLQSSALTKIGDVFMARGKWEEAEKKFNQAIQINPRDERAHQRLGIIYEQKGKINEAIKHYERGLIGTAPGYVGIKVDLARLYNLTKKYQEAVDLLKRVIPETSKNTTAHITLGTAFLGLGMKDEAIREFKIARDLEPQTERGHFSLGVAYREKGNYRESLDELKEVIRIKPKWPDGYYQLGETQFKMEEYENAIKNYKKARDLGMDSNLVKIRMADLYLSQKRYPDAILIYQDLLKLKGVPPKIYDLLGSAYQMNGQLDLAERTFQQMCKKFPRDPFSFYRLGLFYGFVKKYDQSVSQLEKAVSMRPEDAVVLKALSLAYNGKGDRLKAIQTAGKIAKIRPKSIDDKFYLAALYQDADKNEDAKQVYRSILSQKPDHALALNNLADILCEDGELNEAQELAEQAVTIAPDNGMVQDTYGWVLFKRKKNKEALKALNKSASLLPNNPTVLYHLGAVYHAEGNTGEARKNIEKALSVSQDFKEAEEARKLLKK